MATSTIKQVTNTSGSNYCKIPDGTLIQWGFASYEIGTAVKVYSVTFKYQYSDIPVVAVSSGAGGARAPVYVETVGKTGFELTFTPWSGPSTSWARWIAIGRWK